MFQIVPDKNSPMVLRSNLVHFYFRVYDDSVVNNTCNKSIKLQKTLQLPWGSQKRGRPNE